MVPELSLPALVQRAMARAGHADEGYDARETECPRRGGSVPPVVEH